MGSARGTTRGTIQCTSLTSTHSPTPSPSLAPTRRGGWSPHTLLRTSVSWPRRWAGVRGWGWGRQEGAGQEAWASAAACGLIVSPAL